MSNYSLKNCSYVRMIVLTCACMLGEHVGLFMDILDWHIYKEKKEKHKGMKTQPVRSCKCVSPHLQCMAVLSSSLLPSSLAMAVNELLIL